MAMIPVEVQLPNKPQTAHVVGEASDDMTAEEVARRVGVPADCFVDGKIMKGKRGRRWSLIAWVKFREKRREAGTITCPHCGEKISV